MNYIEYSEKELEYLKSQDELLKEVIEKVGFLKRERTPDIFIGIVTSIIGQQISIKAADTIWKRMQSKFGNISPKIIHCLSKEELQSVGITMKKAVYLKNIAKDVEEGIVKLNELNDMSDEEVIQSLISFNGIGVWTAEMLLIFSLGRMNVLSWNDLGIRRGLMRLYHLDELNKDTFSKFKKRYSPYGTIASLYIWEIAKNN